MFVNIVNEFALIKTKSALLHNNLFE